MFAYLSHLCVITDMNELQTKGADRILPKFIISFPERNLSKRYHDSLQSVLSPFLELPL